MFDIVTEEMLRLAAPDPEPAPEAERASVSTAHATASRGHEDAEVRWRAINYVRKMPPGVAGQKGSNATYSAAVALVHGFAMTIPEAKEILLEYHNPFCQPPWSEKELQHKLEDALNKPHDKPRGHLLDDHRRHAEERSAGTPADRPSPAIRSYTLGELIREFPTMREPVIDDLLRVGETMNVIAAPKVGKSWLIAGLAFAVATGGTWLGYQTIAGDVLIIDNELHRETLSNRLRRVAAANLIDLDTVQEKITTVPLRGQLTSINDLGPYLRSLQPGSFKLVIVDAFYRSLPIGTDENDNAMMAGIYNTIDTYADHLGASFALIHHSSKGNQASKAVTDVGSGAGSQSRAADTHLVLRPHEEDNVVVLDAVVRSFPPVTPKCLRWNFPSWTDAPELNPEDLQQATPRRRAEKKKDEPTPTPSEQPEPPPEVPWNAQRFVDEFCSVEPKSTAVIIVEAQQKGLSEQRARTLLTAARDLKIVHFWKDDKNTIFSTLPQPEKPQKTQGKPRQNKKKP